MTEVSVIMATYKEPENQLRRSIESILNQTYKAFEYIIILDNPDNSDHIRIIKEYQQKDNRIQFHINEKNQGLTYSLNRGMQTANISAGWMQTIYLFRKDYSGKKNIWKNVMWI